MHLEWILSGSALLVRYDGELDLNASRRLGRLFSRLGKLDQLVLDLGSARVLQDTALAALVPVIAAHSACRVIVRGLSRHHQRLFRYLTGGSFVEPAPRLEYPS